MSDWTDPEQITRTLRKRWNRGELLAPLVTGESPFPLELPLKRPTARDISDRFGEVMDWVEQLRRGSRERRRRGYELCWRTMGNRIQGANELPVAARLPEAADAWYLLGEQKAAECFQALADETLSRYPQLQGWLARRSLQALDHVEDWPRILAVVDYFVSCPRPGLYLRQLDIPGVDSKFIEARRGLIGELLDEVLPAEHIDTAATGVRGFARRYGLRTEPALVRFRLLDPAATLSGLSDLSVPAEEFARLDVPVNRVFITENRINGLAMPEVARALVVFGLGYGLGPLAGVPWLRDCDVWYWGDIDTHGFAILDRLRGVLPNASSLLMDRATLLEHRSLWGREPADKRYSGEPARLTPPERALFDDLRHDRLGERVRLEQERIGYGWVCRAVAALCADSIDPAGRTGHR